MKPQSVSSLQALSQNVQRLTLWHIFLIHLHLVKLWDGFPGDGYHSALDIATQKLPSRVAKQHLDLCSRSGFYCLINRARDQGLEDGSVARIRIDSIGEGFGVHGGLFHGDEFYSQRDRAQDWGQTTLRIWGAGVQEEAGSY